MYQGWIKIKNLYLPVNIQDEEPETKSTELISQVTSYNSSTQRYGNTTR